VGGQWGGREGKGGVWCVAADTASRARQMAGTPHNDVPLLVPAIICMPTAIYSRFQYYVFHCDFISLSTDRMVYEEALASTVESIVSLPYYIVQYSAVEWLVMSL